MRRIAVALFLALLAGLALVPLLLWQMPWRLGVDAAQLRPVDALPELRSPVLVASGVQDRHTTWAETQRLHAVAVAPREIWGVADAAHVDLYRHDPLAYEARVIGFLARHLRGGG